MAPITKTQSTPPTFLAIDDLSPDTQCELQMSNYAGDDRSFQHEQLIRHQNRIDQVARGGEFWFKTYIDRVWESNGQPENDYFTSTPTELLKALSDDVDTTRSQIIRDFVIQMECPDPSWFTFMPSLIPFFPSAMLCYNDLMHKHFDPYGDRANTTSAAMRSMLAMRFLGEHAALADGPIKNVLIVGAGLDIIPQGFSVSEQPQVQEPFLVMSSILHYFSTPFNDLAIDVADINPLVLRYLNGSRSLHLYWGSRGHTYDESPISNLPLSREPKIIQKDDPSNSFISLEPNNTLFWESADLDSRIMSKIHPQLRDVAFDAAGDPGQYDLIIMLNVGNYLDNMERMLALDNMLHALRAGGLLLTDKSEMNFQNSRHDACAGSIPNTLVKISSDKLDVQERYLFQKQ